MNLKYKLIGLHGKAQAGKDTTGKYMSWLCGYPTYAFAEPIKVLINNLFGWDERHSNGELKEIVDPYWGISPRYAYQTFGTDWGRNLINSDIWLMKAMRTYEQNKSLIITDVRFENEADWIRQNGGIVVHISRESALQVNKHISENGIRFHHDDCWLDNNDDYDNLYNNIHYLIENDLEV